MTTESKMILIIAIMTGLIMIVDGGSWRERWCATYDLCEPVEMAGGKLDSEDL